MQEKLSFKTAGKSSDDVGVGGMTRNKGKKQPSWMWSPPDGNPPHFSLCSDASEGSPMERGWPRDAGHCIGPRRAKRPFRAHG
jgi:hypothetical protein